MLAGTADNFPPSLWDKLLPQTEITLNLLRQSNATPTVSTYAHLNGPFDYNKMPLAPMGCQVQVHEKTDKRGTWAYTITVSMDGTSIHLLNTIPRSQLLYQVHTQHTALRHSPIPTQIDHQSGTHTSRQVNASNRKLQGSTKRHL